MKFARLKEVSIFSKALGPLEDRGDILINLERISWVKRLTLASSGEEYTRICFGELPDTLECVDVREAPDTFLIGCVG